MKPLLVVFAFVVMEAHCLPRWLKFGSDDSAAAVAAAAAAEGAPAGGNAVAWSLQGQPAEC